MTQKRFTSIKTTRAIISEIFEHPPINSVEFKKRLSSIEAASGRRVLMEMLRQSSIHEEGFNLFIEIFNHFGVGEEREELIEILSDYQNNPLARTFAMAVLAQEDPERLSADIGHLDPRELADLADLPLIDILKAIQVDANAALEIVDLLEEAPVEMQEYLLFQLGRCRREMDICPARTYRYALRSKKLAHLHKHMIDAVVKQGSDECIALLTELRDSAYCEEMRRELQGALLRAGTRAIDPDRQQQTPVGIAYLGSCDGQGAFVLLGCFKTPGGSFTTADLCIRAASDVRDGFVIPRHTDGDLQSLMAKLRTTAGCDFVSIPLLEGARIVKAAVDRTRSLNLSIPGDAEPAIELFERFDNMGQDDDIPVEPAKNISLARMRRLLRKPIYRNWFFDIGDYMGVGVKPPTRANKLDQWYAEAASKLNTTLIRARLLAMTRHMADWHNFKGESGLAAVCLAAYNSVRTGFSRSTLVHAMLERSLETMALEEADGSRGFGDSQMRQYLKACFFQDIESPRGWDLALLDFAEVALSNLETAFSTLPGEIRPRDEEKPMIAFTIAKAMLRVAQNRSEMNADHHLRSLALDLTSVCQLDSEECEQFGALVLEKLIEYVDEICPICPVACLERPDEDISDVFFSTRHPVEK